MFYFLNTVALILKIYICSYVYSEDEVIKYIKKKKNTSQC